MSAGLAFPAVWDAAEEAQFFLIPSRGLGCELHDLEGSWEETGRVAERNIRGHWKDVNAASDVRDSVKKPTH